MKDFFLCLGTLESRREHVAVVRSLTTQDRGIKDRELIGGQWVDSVSVYVSVGPVYVSIQSGRC